MTAELDLCAMAPYAEKDHTPTLRDSIQAVINVLLSESRYGLSAEQTRTLAAWLQERIEENR